MRAFWLAAACTLLAAAAARAQPAPTAPPPAAQEELGRDLFGEDEPMPGDEAAAEAAGPLADAPAAKAPPSDANARAYDQRLRQSYAAAEAFEGKLDGGWKVVSAKGRPLLQLQLADKGDGQVEGAWRDLLAPSTPAVSGLLDRTPIDQGRLYASFFADGLPYRLELHHGRDGRWSGRFWRGDEGFDVRLVKTAP